MTRNIKFREPLASQANQAVLLQIYSDLYRGFPVRVGGVEFNTRLHFNEWLDQNIPSGGV